MQEVLEDKSRRRQKTAPRNECQFNSGASELQEVSRTLLSRTKHKFSCDPPARPGAFWNFFFSTILVPKAAGDISTGHWFSCLHNCVYSLKFAMTRGGAGGIFKKAVCLSVSQLCVRKLRFCNGCFARRRLVTRAVSRAALPFSVPACCCSARLFEKGGPAPGRASNQKRHREHNDSVNRIPRR